MNPTPVFLIFVFFVYGLAFFVMGLAIALESRRASALTLRSSLPFLALFGLLHSAVEWMDMFSLIMAQDQTGDVDLSLRQIRILFLAASSVFLVLFGTRLLAATNKKYRSLRFVPAVLFGGWLVSFVIPHLSWIPTADALSFAGVCVQCHRGDAAATYVTMQGDWIVSADVWARYVLFLPGSILASFAMFSQGPLFRSLGFKRVESYCTWAGVAFGANAFVSGLIVPPAPYFPASVLNYASFFSWFLVPPQVVTALLSIVIAYYMVRTLSVFEIERLQQVQMANRDRFAAQQQALESQRAARAQLEEWNRRLEETVEQRTKEVEVRNRELAILEERDRLASEMHDSLGQVLGYLGLKILEVQKQVGNIRTEQAMISLNQMAKAVEDACADVRESILCLKTTVSSERSLVSALREYVPKYREQSGLRCELVVDESVELRLSTLAEAQLLRIVQEALTNVRKHAQAANVRVVVDQRDGETMVSVEDDGHGFDLDQVMRRKGHRFGLSIMSERAEEIGGAFSVDTAPGQGTRISVRLSPIMNGGGVG
ncbi:MAG: sensor histidine kinase [Chloroflexota bacterium]|nr:MAG: sensor histidine kinase [Chloroflexota bacterium]